MAQKLFEAFLDISLSNRGQKTDTPSRLFHDSVCYLNIGGDFESFKFQNGNKKRGVKEEVLPPNPAETPPPPPLLLSLSLALSGPSAPSPQPPSFIFVEGSSSQENPCYCDQFCIYFIHHVYLVAQVLGFKAGGPVSSVDLQIKPSRPSILLHRTSKLGCTAK